MTLPDAERWKRLSPLLDGLLDLAPAQRAGRLGALHGEDPALAAELAALIDDAERAEGARFLAGSAPPLLGDAAGAAEGPSLAGLAIGAYVLEAPLGQGGTGTVWRARRADGRFKGAVAVKLLHLSLVGRTGALRFEREGMVLARLSHPHIARLLDAGMASGVASGTQPYLVLELVEGERIDRHCDAAHLNVGQRVALFRVVLEAVAHAHRHLVIHRDIKPGNILVDREGSVKLLDFGIAKLLQGDDGAGPPGDLTGDGMRALTPDYAAPEQLRGEDVTTATDVYALGVLLYLLLTGRHPTAPPHGTPADTIRATLDTDPERLSTAVTVTGDFPAEAVERIAGARDTSPNRLKRQLGGDLENIVAKALKKAQAERYPTVDAFAEDLRRWAAGEPVSARPDSIAYRTTRFVGRHRGAVAAAVLTLAAILAGLAGTITQARRAEQQRALAEQAAETARQERDNALQQTLLQRGTNEFLQLLLRDAAGGDPGAIRKQLDRASALIDKTTFEAPIIKIALLRQLAGRYSEAGETAESVVLLRKAIAALPGTDLAAPTSAVPFNLACSLARLLLQAGDLPGARAEVTRAEAMLTAGARVSEPSVIECRGRRADIELALGHHEAALGIARTALQQLEAAGIRQGEQHRIAVSAVSQVLAAAGRAAEGLQLARPLLAESTAAQGRESMAVLRRSDVVTRLTRISGDPLAALALSEADRADANRLLAGRPDVELELEYGRILIELARFDEASATLERAAAVAVERGRGVYVLPIGLARVEARLGAGDAAGAARLLGEIAPERADALAAGREEEIEALRLEGLLASARGESAAAAQRLAAAQARVDASGAGIHPQRFALAMARASVAAAAGAAAGTPSAELPALAEAAVAAAPAGAIDVERSSRVGRALWLKAQAAAAAGRRDDARRDAAVAARQLEVTLGAGHPLAAAARRFFETPG